MQVYLQLLLTSKNLALRWHDMANTTTTPTNNNHDDDDNDDDKGDNRHHTNSKTQKHKVKDTEDTNKSLSLSNSCTHLAFIQLSTVSEMGIGSVFVCVHVKLQLSFFAYDTCKLLLFLFQSRQGVHKRSLCLKFI